MHTCHRLLIIASLALLAVAAPTSGQTRPGDTARLVFFEKKVRPVLASNCYTCHSADTNSQGGLRLDDRNGILTGGKRGPALVVGAPEKSLLIQAVRHTHAKLKMPPKQHLSETEIAGLEQWIKDGASWPRVELPASVGRYREKYAALKKAHWAWQPLRDARAPMVRDAAWPRGDIDRFVLAALEAKSLRPVRDADRVTLIRRLTFDLTGLPPTPAEIDAFVDDASGVAYERLVDRLLESAAFGERWGRHWLDVARYAESTGPSRNIPYPHAWRYRDYDKPQFRRDGGRVEPGAVAGRMHTTDLHATLLALIRLDHEQLTYRYAGRDFRLTDVAGHVATDILA